MKEILMMKGANKLIRMCGGVKKGEVVTIVADMLTIGVASDLAKAAYEVEPKEKV